MRRQDHQSRFVKLRHYPEANRSGWLGSGDGTPSLQGTADDDEEEANCLAHQALDGGVSDELNSLLVLLGDFCSQRFERLATLIGRVGDHVVQIVEAAVDVPNPPVQLGNSGAGRARKRTPTDHGARTKGAPQPKGSAHSPAPVFPPAEEAIDRDPKPKPCTRKTLPDENTDRLLGIGVMGYHEPLQGDDASDHLEGDARERQDRASSQLVSVLTPIPIGQATPVPLAAQYPFGFFARYCWW